MPEIGDPVGGLVPPGGTRPLADEPWPARPDAFSETPTPRPLPGVPEAVPDGVEQPTDWRQMRAGTATDVPPGYQQTGDPPLYQRTRADRWGIVSCVTAIAGWGQLLLVFLPVLSVLAVIFGAVGRQASELDPYGVRARGSSTAGMLLGGVGIAAGLSLAVFYRRLAGIVDI